MSASNRQSQSRPKLVPWKVLGDLLWAKAAFYPEAGASDQRADALSLVRAWSVRGKLPHAIEATAMLTEAILHDVPGMSQLQLQLSYATAICRFVNGLLDPAQQSHFAVSMHVLAKNLNLPASFVEIRHAATHEALPSLPVLRAAGARGLQWLWSNYWVWINETETPDEPIPENVHVPRAKALLKQWRQLRRDNPGRQIKEGENARESKEAIFIMKECVAFVDAPNGSEALIEVMLEEKGLIPAGRNKLNIMRGAFALWTPLLQHLDAVRPAFMEQLVYALFDLLSPQNNETILLADAQLDPDEHWFTQAISAWLKYLTTEFKPSSNSPYQSGSIDVDELVKNCIIYPNRMRYNLLKAILRVYEHLRSKYGIVIDYSKTHIPVHKKKIKYDGVPRRKLDDIESEVRLFEENLARLEEKLASNLEGRNAQTNGEVPDDNDMDETEDSSNLWKEHQGVWIPRPIGVE